jgi:hypothetical protein
MKMRKTFSILITLIISQNVFAQSIQDYKEYIKDNVEAAPPLNNYMNLIYFGTMLDQSLANRITNKSLSYDEYSNLFVYGYDIFMNANKVNKAWSTFYSCDLRKIRKATVIEAESEIQIIIYLQVGYSCTEYSTPSTFKYRDNINIGLKTSKKTAENIKNAIIKLAELSGAGPVLDGNSMFND